MHRIDVRNLTVAADQLSLNVPHLRFDQGRTCCVIGRSGSGKSLFAAALSGLPMHGLKVTGNIAVSGKEQTVPLWKEHVFVLPQEPAVALNPTMQIGRQVAEVFRWRRNPDSRWNTADALCTQVGLSATDLEKFPSQLSGGMQQRVMIAMALAARAAFVVADEPTKGLDTENKLRVIELFKLVQASGRGLIIITHDLDVVRALADVVVVFDKGEVVEQGPRHPVLQQPKSKAAKTLIQSEPTNWPHHNALEQPASEACISLQDITFGFSNSCPLISNASINIHSGEIVGLHGPSGAGKSTLGDICLGLHTPTHGVVTWCGEPLTPTVLRRERIRFQKLFQNPVTSFPPNLVIGDVFEKLTPGAHISPLSKARLMARLGIDELLLRRRPDQVSGGELQRLALVRVLLSRPKFLVCDEPSSRLDMSIQRLAIDVITEYASESSAAVLLISHDLSVLQKRTGRIFELTGNGALLQKTIVNKRISRAPLHSIDLNERIA